MVYTQGKQHEVEIPNRGDVLDGFLLIPEQPKGIVLFVHGSGSSRFSSRNQYVANYLNQSNLATLLFDLLTPDEEAVDVYTREYRFDIGLLATRLIEVTKWSHSQFPNLNIGYFGSSTGGAAALMAAAYQKEEVKAIVSRSGRPDLAGEYLPTVETPTLLIVGELDDVVIDLNKQAMSQMHCGNKLEIVPGATHLFEEPGTLDEVAKLTKNWFLKHLTPTQG
ncbi:dienelactone hydrolase family protein [Legionella yabuuchiae]|uniref:dienelactone hydrolase family protein n=1 Tax=Legionella yabuuchiae TaxID=376727 RepID=UPI001056578D|nr:dienelactone hydrolase family protein [Legionella yabuuchiae]